uniref:WRKY transcription factor 51-like n=1 Tax=Cymbidium sinense TaxID=112615 RepID=A0A2P1JMM0_9ASPA|nr:WRKY transcription factor 51-like [Cymbidium sinense]
MAALLEPTEKNGCISTFQFTKLLHSGCKEGSPSAIAGGGQSDFDAFDFVQIEKGQFFEGELMEAPTSRMFESGDVYDCELEYVEVKRRKVEAGCRIGFRTKSEVDVLDDGFKWRKYGKKAVKNSPNPRNYYRCSSQGCEVKKRVERDRSDFNYVITIYEGTHNHISPDIKPYTTNLSAPSHHSWNQQF